MSAADHRTVGELLADSEELARETLLDATPDQALAMVRSWSQLVGSAAELWAVLPSTPDSPSGLDPMELLRAVGEAIGRSVTAGHWPGQGPTDEHLTEIAHNLSRARHLVEPHGHHSQQAAPETQRDIQDLHGQVMHTLYVAAHGTAVALRMTPRTFVSTSRSTIQRFQGGSEVAGGSVRKTVDLIWSVVFIGWGFGLRR